MFGGRDGHGFATAQERPTDVAIDAVTDSLLGRVYQQLTRNAAGVGNPVKTLGLFAKSSRLK